jgi:hypothetical protein
MSPCSLMREAKAEAKSWMCGSCLTPQAHVKAVNVWLQERVPPNKPLNFVYSCSVPLIHRDLLQLFGADNISRDLYLGRVFGERENELSDWVTARGRRQIIVRGDRDASFRLCPACGRVLYFGTGKRYLYPAPPAGAQIFESDYNGFIVTAEIYERVKAAQFRKLRVEELAVVDVPLDGLGVLPTDQANRR